MLPPLLFSVRAPTLLASFWRAHLSRQSSYVSPRRGPLSFILFRLDALGDVVMTTPLFRELKRTCPNSHLTVVVQAAFRSLLVTNPHIDQILTVREVKTRWLPRRAKKLLAALILYWTRLRGRHYDVAISPRWDLDEHLATLLCVLTNATVSLGYSEAVSPLKQTLNRGFDDAFSICLRPGPLQHEVLRNLAFITTLGGVVQESSLDIRVTERNREQASRLLGPMPDSTTLIALGIGAHSASRRWPLEFFAQSVARLARHGPVQPVILCSSSERPQALELAGLLSCEPILSCGAPLRDVCALLERCDLLIGNDSGTAHLAAAMDCRTIVISRHPRDGDPNHSNSPRRFAPYCERYRVLQPNSGLDGCASSCRSHEAHCITAVSVEEVVAAARQMLVAERVPPVPISEYAKSKQEAGVLRLRVDAGRTLEFHRPEPVGAP